MLARSQAALIGRCCSLAFHSRPRSGWLPARPATRSPEEFLAFVSQNNMKAFALLSGNAVWANM